MFICFPLEAQGAIGYEMLKLDLSVGKLEYGGKARSVGMTTNECGFHSIHGDEDGTP